MRSCTIFLALTAALAGCDDDTTTATDMSVSSDLAAGGHDLAAPDLAGRDLATTAPADLAGSDGGGTTTPTPASIMVTPSPAIVPVATTLSLTARALDGAGQPIPGITFVWTTADAVHAAVDANGSVSGMLASGEHGFGPVAVTAAASGQSGATNVFVAAHPTWDFAAGAANVSVDADGGQYVVFHNDDGAPHSVVLDSGTALTGTFTASDSTPVHVTLAAGSYTFHCGIHASMHGTLVVH